jgi:hypothetical protein
MDPHASFPYDVEDTAPALLDRWVNAARRGMLDVLGRGTPIDVSDEIHDPVLQRYGAMLTAHYETDVDVVVYPPHGAFASKGLVKVNGQLFSDISSSVAAEKCVRNALLAHVRAVAGRKHSLNDANATRDHTIPMAYAVVHHYAQMQYGIAEPTSAQTRHCAEILARELTHIAQNFSPDGK